MKNYSGFSFEEKYITDQLIRLKLTSDCQCSCHFCHMEGSPFSPDLVWSQQNRDSILKLLSIFSRTRVHLTGGEPTTYKFLPEVIQFFSNNNIKTSITTNGRFSKQLAETLVKCGCNNFTVSLISLDTSSFMLSQKNNLTSFQTQHEIDSTLENIEFLSKIAKCNVNMVCSNSSKNQLQIIDYCLQSRIDLNLLNVVGNYNKSQKHIALLLENKKDILIPHFYEKVKGTSRASFVFHMSKSFSVLEVKILENTFLGSMCKDCQKFRRCDERYYGIRVEQNEIGLVVRSCLHQNILIPIDDFIFSEIGKEILSGVAKWDTI